MVLYSEVAGAIVDVIINTILIPRYTSVGAAIGTLIAELVVFVVQYMALRNEISDILKEIHYFRITIAIILGVIVGFLGKVLEGSFATLVISAILFFGIYGLFLLKTKEEMIVEIYNMVVRKVKFTMKDLQKRIKTRYGKG